MIADGNQVAEAQLELLLGLGKHPVAGTPLGLAFPAYKSVAERIYERVAALDPALGPAAPPTSSCPPGWWTARTP